MHTKCTCGRDMEIEHYDYAHSYKDINVLIQSVPHYTCFPCTLLYGPEKLPQETEDKLSVLAELAYSKGVTHIHFREYNLISNKEDK